MLELRHLRYFVAVAQELNFSRAAESLHMAQPPLSAAIRQLEQELATELFVRSTREVKLTAAGEVLLEGARRTLTEADRAATATRRAAAGELGSLRLAFSWSARFDTLPQIGQALRTRHPDIELLAEEMWNARMPQALRSGAVDLALSLCPEIAAGLEYEPIRREQPIVLLAATHPLANKGAVSLSTFAQESFVLFPRELAPRLHDVLVGFCRSAGFEPGIRTESFHTGWELQILDALPVVALAPESVSRDLPPGVVARPLDAGYPALATSLVFRSGDLPPAGRVLRDVATSLFDLGEQAAATAAGQTDPV